MSIQFACDRCKQVIELKPRWDAEPGELPDGLKRFGGYHLCTACVGKVKDFIEQPAYWHKAEE